MTTGKPNLQIVGLDVLRSAAAFFVMVFHLVYWLWAGGFEPKPARDGGLLLLTPLTWFGWSGVEIFFVLSGFVIAYSASHATPLDFARSRFLRLYPTAWICASITLIVSLLVPHDANLSFYLRGWFHAAVLSPRALWIDGSYWTLPVELIFYTLIFLLLVCRSFHRLSAVMTVLGLYSTVVCFYRWLFYAAARQRGHAIVWFVGNGRNFPTGPVFLRYGLFFSVGALLWLCLFERVTLMRCIALTVFAAGAFAEFSEHVENIVSISHPADAPVWAPFLGWLCAVVFMVFSVKYNGAVHKALGLRGVSVARMLGLMTYPLYLLHQHVGNILILEAMRYMPIPLAVFLVCVCMVVLSYVVVVYLEKPLRKKLQQLLHASNKAQAGPASMP